MQSKGVRATYQGCTLLWRGMDVQSDTVTVLHLHWRMHPSE